MDSGQQIGSSRSKRRRTTVLSYAESSASSEKSSGEEFSEGDELDEEKEEDGDLSIKELYHKYQNSASVISKAMKKLILECKPNMSIVDLCKLGDEYMNKECQSFLQRKRNKTMQVGIAIPTCISVNNRLCYVSPISSDNTSLKPDDIVKIQMSFDTDGCIASLAHTHVVAEKIAGRTADVLGAASAARNVVLSLLKFGMEKKELESSISCTIEGYNCKLLKFECWSLERLSHENLKGDAAFKLNKAYSIDIVVGTSDTQFHEEDSSDVFRIMAANAIKARSVPMFYFTMSKEFQERAFSIRSLENQDDNELATVLATRKSEFLQSYPIFRTDDDGVLVARLQFTLFLTEKGPQDKTDIRLQKGYSKKQPYILSYRGKVPVGTNAMGIIPSVHSISWALYKKGRRKNVNKRKDEEKMLICTGSLGTYAFKLSKIHLNEENLGDLELDWTNEKISDLCGHKCECCPRENIVAMAVVDDFNRADVYLLNICERNINPLSIFQTQVGQGINSLSWSSNGLHLLCTFNHATVFAVVFRKKEKLASSGFQLVEFTAAKKDKADYFGVFHPNMKVIFIVTSSDLLGVYKYDDKQADSKAAYYMRHKSNPSGSGFCGITISCDGDFVICPRVDGSILGLKLDNLRLTNNSTPFYDVIFNLPSFIPTPFVSIKSSPMNPTLFAILDKGQIIRAYRYDSSEMGATFLCDNKLDVDGTRACCDFTAFSWRNRLLALGGEDGFLHFWTLSDSDRVPYVVKKRNILSEKLFYEKRRLELGSGQLLGEKNRELEAKLLEMVAHGNQSIQIVDLLEQRIKKAENLGNDMLYRLQHTEEAMPAAEVRKFAEQIVEALTTVDD